MPEPLLAVDAPSVLFVAFYALPGTIRGAQGQPVNALLGGVNIVLREVLEHRPRGVVMCFGDDAATYRVELFDGYHADRGPVPDEAGRRSRPHPPSTGRSVGECTTSAGWRRTTCSTRTRSASSAPAVGR